MFWLLADFSLSGIWSGNWWSIKDNWNGIFSGIDVAAQSFLALILNWIKYQFSPAYIVDSGFSILSWIVNSVGSMVGGDVGNAMKSSASFMDSAIVSKSWAICLFFLSPVLHATVINSCIDAIFLCWFFVVVTRCIVWVLSMVWSSPG